MPVDPARAKFLFLEASDLSSPADRAVFLDRECGSDQQLRARVEVLAGRAGPGRPGAGSLGRRLARARPDGKSRGGSNHRVR